MSLNHFSSDLPEPIWWSPHHQHNLHSSPSSNSNKPNNPLFSNSSFFNPQNDDEELQDQDPVLLIEKETMFEKPLTPSDVGKLNRLVIPKQHAEKYFPLGGGGGGDSVDNPKGLLLSFEDELGKCWRFRYSYWNSSQSYVLTKGWSRYVKEKQLDAGDVVLFERHRTDGERLFIGWRRRGDGNNNINSGGGMMVQGSGGGVWSRGLYSSPSSSGHQPYQHGHGGATVTSSVPYQPDCLHAGTSLQQQQQQPVGNSKRLRLFGVNLECQLDDPEPSTPDGSCLSSQGLSLTQQHHLYTYHSSPNSCLSHMEEDMIFSRDVKQQQQMRNRRG